LKAALAEKGIASEFLEGQLVCSGSVTVKRTDEDAGVILEGPLSEEYYRIRSVLYGQYHVC
jgi:cleavage and polyadenylation specificity factor subunit 2